MKDGNPFKRLITGRDIDFTSGVDLGKAYTVMMLLSEHGVEGCSYITRFASTRIDVCVTFTKKLMVEFSLSAVKSIGRNLRVDFLRVSTSTYDEYSMECLVDFLDYYLDGVAVTKETMSMDAPITDDMVMKFRPFMGLGDKIRCLGCADFVIGINGDKRFTRVGVVIIPLERSLGQPVWSLYERDSDAHIEINHQIQEMHTPRRGVVFPVSTDALENAIDIMDI